MRIAQRIGASFFLTASRCMGWGWGFCSFVCIFGRLDIGFDDDHHVFIISIRVDKVFFLFFNFWGIIFTLRIPTTTNFYLTQSPLYILYTLQQRALQLSDRKPLKTGRTQSLPLALKSHISTLRTAKPDSSYPIAFPMYCAPRLVLPYLPQENSKALTSPSVAYSSYHTPSRTPSLLLS